MGKIIGSMLDILTNIEVTGIDDKASEGRNSFHEVVGQPGDKIMLKITELSD